MTTKIIRFSFDYISSNAYLAWIELPKLAAKYGFTIEPIPVLFAGLLEAHGQLGPAEVGPKSFWMAKNNKRKALLLDVPLNTPAFHPFNPLLALRASSIPTDPVARDRLITALFAAVWADRLHVSEPAVVQRCADGVGLDGAALVAEAQRPERKEHLRRATSDAVARGVFGVPTMEIGDELFWGYDDFPYLELFLAGKDPLATLDLARYSESPKPSAMRKRVQPR